MEWNILFITWKKIRISTEFSFAIRREDFEEAKLFYLLDFRKFLRI